jgi:hypothetical protein
MFHAWWPLEGKGETSFSPTSPFHLKRFYLNIFSIDFRVLLYHGYKPLLCIFHSFSLIYKLHSRISMYQVFHTFIIKLILIKDFLFFLEFMALCMTTTYGPQVAQVNEKPFRNHS